MQSWTRKKLVDVLGRPENVPNINSALHTLSRKTVLVTGASGSIGTALCKVLATRNIRYVPTDIDTMDVTNANLVTATIMHFKPDVIFHLAANKHAPLGEESPIEVAGTNIEGTANVLRAGEYVGARVVTASTCKACDPETAYGASKLIAERATLNAGQSIARFYNVVETQGNVFDIWSQIPESEPIPVTECKRYFVTLSEAVALIIKTATLSPGRYSLPNVELRKMADVASACYPGRIQEWTPQRRGDRTDEPLIARNEFYRGCGGKSDDVVQVVSWNDPSEVQRPQHAWVLGNG